MSVQPAEFPSSIKGSLLWLSGRVPSPPVAFLLLGSIFGLAFLLATPPALVGDEPNHFFRAYQISKGEIVGKALENGRGGWLPRSVFETNRKLVGDIEMNHHIKFNPDLIWELRQVPLCEDDLIFVPFHNTVIYAPVAYAPQALGILIGRAFDASALTLIYVARLFNLVAFLGLTYLALRITPVFKWTFCFLWLTPTTLFQGSSASIDAFTFGICFVTVAMFLRFALVEDARLSEGAFALLIALCVICVLSKQAYVMLPLLYLAIPARKMGSTVLYLAGFAALMLVCVGAITWWSSIAKPLFLPYRGDVVINPDEQMSLILQNPLGFIWTLITTYARMWRYYFVTFWGQLIWLDLFVPRVQTVFLFLVTLGAALYEKGDVQIKNFQRLLFSVIILGTLFLVSVLLYLTWSPVGGDRIAGIQGRYFIPVAPLFFLLFHNRKLYWASFDRWVPLAVTSITTVSLLITLVAIIERYYI
jgi:uncharacterized membrane protein